jgi:hypothetical protein
MRAAVAFVALVMAACGQTAAPPGTAESVEAAPAPSLVGEPMSTGLMGGISTTASGEVAALTIGADNLAFSNSEGEETFATPTEFLGVWEASDLIAAGGESFAAAAPNANATRAEVRRIIGAPYDRLCGGMAATHIALVSTEPLTGLQLMVFTGAAAPGPNARDSEICAIYAYAVD